MLDYKTHVRFSFISDNKMREKAKLAALKDKDKSVQRYRASLLASTCCSLNRINRKEFDKSPKKVSHFNI